MSGTSVINPMFFYWMDVLGGFELFLFAVVIGAVGWCVIEVAIMNRPNFKKLLKPLLVMITVGLLIVLIPNKETMLAMLVADLITYENIELTKESAIAIIDYIVEQVNMITR